jgi:hypothetical protein
MWARNVEKGREARAAGHVPAQLSHSPVERAITRPENIAG